MALRSPRILALLAALLCAPFVRAQEEAPASRPAEAATSHPAAAADYVRFTMVGKDSGKLQTAVATFTDDKGRSIDLIGAVHIGDRAYYKKLNDSFAAYDSVLYEMVKPEKMETIPAQRGEATGLSAFQQGLGRMLGLSFQLDGIDYNAKNFVHADMTAERLSEIMDERHINTWSIIVDVLFESLRNADQLQNAKQPSLVDLVKVFFADDRAHELKMVLGPMMGEVETSMGGLGKSKIGKLILEERNDVALKVLDERLEKGEKKLGVFYGAAHLEDMGKKLETRGFKKSGVKWMTAWRVDAPKPAAEKKDRL